MPSPANNGPSPARTTVATRLCLSACALVVGGTILWALAPEFRSWSDGRDGVQAEPNLGAASSPEPPKRAGAASINRPEESGRDLPPARLTSNVTELDFATVPIGTRATRQLLLTNNALDDTTITISSAWLSESDALEFSTDFRGPRSVAPGGSISIELTFSPREAGHRLGALYVSSDGADNLGIFTLSGNGAITSTRRAITRRNVAPAASSVSFGKSTLKNLDDVKPTSLQFGPDGRLYVADMLGLIKVFDVEREGDNDYRVTATETITSIRDIANHDDDGKPNSKVNKRLVTGLLVVGTASQPIIYVNSSDPRIGGGPSHTETHLDTNSGVLSRLERKLDGSGWKKTDLVRGLPRSEENHHPNGLVLDEATNRLYTSTGGNTNQGGTSNNFALLPEFALSAAILEIDLGRIGDDTYDLPTLDDETRPGSNDAGDPFGGNDGLNQAKLVPGGPVQVYAPGFRNAYDVVLTESGRMYTIDNGGNSGWGGPPVNEGAAGVCTNGQSEPGKTNRDSLHHVSGRGYYGGHPNPTRGNMNNTFNASIPQSPVSVANAIECEHRPSGGSSALATFGTSVNGLVEYRASNFGGAMRGDLLAVTWKNLLYRLKLSADGSKLDEQTTLFSSVGKTPLDVTAQADHERFPGTIWVADFGSRDIVIFEPVDFNGSVVNLCDGGSSDADEDQDGYSNEDEVANGTDPCSAADLPSDLDGDLVSDLLDKDDDDDGLVDLADPFSLDPQNGRGTPIPLSYTWENDSKSPGFLFNLGFSGLMNNGTTDYLDQFDPNNVTAGGAAGVFTIDNIPPGDAVTGRNDQEYAFQFGVDVTPSTPVFTVRTRVLAPFSGATLGGYQSMGLYIGTGDQDHYIKLVANGSGATGGVEFAAEYGGDFQTIAQTDAAVLGSDQVDLFLVVDPAAGTVTPFHQVKVDGKLGSVVQSGKAALLPTTWLTGDSGLAVGILSTSFKGLPFDATWDFIEITDGDAFDATNAEVVGSGDITIGNGDEDDNGDAADGENGEGAQDAGGVGSSGDNAIHVAKDGVIAIEAERFAGQSTVETHRWVEGQRVGASGNASMITTPDNGTLKRGSWGSPQLHYTVEFPEAGPWTVWVRGWGDADDGEGKSDSVHVGLDGDLSSAAAMDGFPQGGWHWSRSTRAGQPAVLYVEQAGVHTVNVWMREDGLELDRLVLTESTAYVPAGIGPASVTRQDQNGTDAEDASGHTDGGQVNGSDDGSIDTGGAGSVDGDATDMGGDDHGSVGGALSDDTIVIEAEHFDIINGTSSHRWVAGQHGGASADGSMRAAPDIGELRRDQNGSPQLRYKIDFPSAGDWKVWIRGWGDAGVSGEGKSDSVHVGLNGILGEAAAMDGFPGGAWHWSSGTRGGGTATLTVEQPGQHIVNVWMREDGFEFDRFVLTQSEQWVPSGMGLPATGGTGNTDDAESAVDDTGASEYDGAGDGLEVVGGHIVLEAEAYGALTGTAGHQWAAGQRSGAVGTGSMIATPDEGALKRDSLGSPQLEYTVDFPSAGTWTVWIRGWGDADGGEGKSDSIHVGLDGELSTASAIDGFPQGSWAWSRSRRGGGTAVVIVDEPGVHTVNVWMREDGFEFDRILLTQSDSFTPTGSGPTP